MNNPQTALEIREMYRHFGGNIHKVAKELGLKSQDVSRSLSPAPIQLRPDFHDDQPQPNLKELGRESLRPWIIAYRHSHSGWSEQHRGALSRARQAYDAGTHIMVQSRDGCWIIQYLWPRKKPLQPINWFYGPVF